MPVAYKNGTAMIIKIVPIRPPVWRDNDSPVYHRQCTTASTPCSLLRLITFGRCELSTRLSVEKISLYVAPGRLKHPSEV